MPNLLLDEIRSAGVRLWIEGDQLHYRVPNSSSYELLGRIKDNKQVLMSELTAIETEEERRAKSILHLDKLSESDRFLPVRIEKMWRTELEKNGAAPIIPFDISFSILLEKGTNVDFFLESIHSVVERHESLRTRLAIIDDRPVQVIAPNPSNVNLKVVPITGSVRSNATAVKEASSRVLYPPIEFLSEIGFRARIFIDDDGNTVFAAVLHHYVCDYWSTRILMSEIRRDYSTRSGDRKFALATSPFQYCEYTRIQRRALLEKLPAYLGHWARAIQGVAPAALPYDHVRKTDQMEPLFYVIKPYLISRLRRLALSLKTTLFVVLLAGYQILLSRWTGHNDVVNAISVADRGGSRYSTVFGYLITALPVASRIHGDRTIADFISQLAVQLDGGYPYKEFSYELYEDVFRPPKPFCPTLFNYIPVDRLTPEICGSDYEEDPDKLLFLSGPPFERQMHHREIYFELVELLVGLRGRIYFNTDYFARPSIERLVQHYIYILEQFADNSSARCKEVI